MQTLSKWPPPSPLLAKFFFNSDNVWLDIVWVTLLPELGNWDIVWVSVTQRLSELGVTWTMPPLLANFFSTWTMSKIPLDNCVHYPDSKLDVWGRQCQSWKKFCQQWGRVTQTMSNLDIVDARVTQTLSELPCPPVTENFQLGHFLTGALADWDKCCPANVHCPWLILYLKV